MKPTIQSIHFDADAKLLQFIEDKVSKFDHFYNGIVDLQVYLRLDKDDKQGNKVVEIKVLVPNEVLLATEQNGTFEAAAVKAADNMKRQLSRYKERLVAHY